MMMWCWFLLVVLSAWAGASGLGLEEETTRNNRYSDVLTLERLIKGYVNELTETKVQLRSLVDKFNAANKVVAFHAYHHSDPFSVASKGTIVYNAVSINTGNGYDSLTGIFTAPVSGTYSFFINCMAVDGTSEEPSILVNGATIASCYSWKLNGQAWEQGATQGIARLISGDRVWVRMLEENTRHVRGGYWNTFSGFLIRADV